MKIRARTIVSALPLLTAISFMRPSIADAQSPRAVTLGAPNAELGETFNTISSLRELGDGRVIISDSRDKTVQIIDLGKQTVTKIGRLGSGPGEFQSAGTLYALAGDTTLLSDFANSRYLVISAEGKAIATRAFSSWPFEVANLVGMDERGGHFLRVLPKSVREEGGVQTIVRYDPTTKHVDTITTIDRPKGLMSGATALGGGLLKMSTNLPFAPEDVVSVARDGRVVVARSNGYHVESFARDGKKTTGAVVNFSPIAINDAEKRAFLEKQVRPGVITVRNGATGNAMPMNQSAAPKILFNKETYDDRGMTWPANKPPFAGGALSVDALGRAWVLRNAVHSATQLQYDVFDPNGKLILTVVIPPNTKVAGFGAKSVYLAFNDEDDLQHLRRYALP